ncbi:MAG: polysaccharide biosynthesis/export family protein [Rhodanobacteraceae bacterium]|nr:polysaccharide biosynthesis/export family protein [Rhodanobacteraceae bacterium]
MIPARPAARPQDYASCLDVSRQTDPTVLSVSQEAVLSWLLRCALAVLVVFPWSLVQAEEPAAPATSPEAANTGEQLYRIGVDDRLQVSVWRNPDLSVTVPVRPDGRISVPLVGDVLAGGRAPHEVAADIERQLAVYVRDPKVVVILTELRSHEFISRVRVTGAVRQPVSIPYRQGMTVLDAVLQAGGVSDFAAADRTRLYRKRPGSKTETLPVRLGAILRNGDLDTNVDVQPGDVITVPERAL